MNDAISRKYDQLASLRQPILADPLAESTGNWRVLADFIEEVMVREASSRTDALGWQAQCDLIRADCLKEEISKGPDTPCKACGWASTLCKCPHRPWANAASHLSAVIGWLRRNDFSLSSTVWTDPDHEDYLIYFGFRRGLVNSVTLSLESFLDHWPTLFDRHPITQVTITDTPEVYRVRETGTVLGHPVEERQYAWRRYASSNSPSIAGGVPSWVFKHLPASAGQHRLAAVVYPGLENAQKSLGLACLAAARERLNLPTISQHEVYHEPDTNW